MVSQIVQNGIGEAIFLSTQRDKVHWQREAVARSRSVEAAGCTAVLQLAGLQPPCCSSSQQHQQSWISTTNSKQKHSSEPYSKLSTSATTGGSGTRLLSLLSCRGFIVLMYILTILNAIHVFLLCFFFLLTTD